MQAPKHGKLLSAALVFLLSSCRTSQPPIIEVCIADGFGGMDCVEHDQSRLYRPPSESLNYWCTNSTDEAAFASWAYDTSESVIRPQMKIIRDRAK